jgi:hypothetical protein
VIENYHEKISHEPTHSQDQAQYVFGFNVYDTVAARRKCGEELDMSGYESSKTKGGEEI